MAFPPPVLVIRKDFTVSYMNQAAKTSAPNNGRLADAIHFYQLPLGRDTPCGIDAERCPVKKVFKTGNP